MQEQDREKKNTCRRYVKAFHPNSRFGSSNDACLVDSRWWLLFHAEEPSSDKLLCPWDVLNVLHLQSDRYQSLASSPPLEINSSHTIKSFSRRTETLAFPLRHNTHPLVGVKTYPLLCHETFTDLLHEGWIIFLFESCYLSSLCTPEYLMINWYRHVS